MKQYIDKDALVAEIDRRKEKYITERLKAETINGKNILGARIAMLEEVLVLINTLEVKDVDLEKEIEKCLKQHNMLAVGKKDFTDIANHFFELGVRTSNHITEAD